jgi:hypothetical protein
MPFFTTTLTRNASVLELNKAKTFELFLVSISDKSKGVPVAKRLLDAQFIPGLNKEVASWEVSAAGHSQKKYNTWDNQSRKKNLLEGVQGRGRCGLLASRSKSSSRSKKRGNNSELHGVEYRAFVVQIWETHGEEKWTERAAFSR